LVAALPQLVTYGRGVWTGGLPGSAYEPRVEAFLEVSRNGALGGPFATVREGDHFSTAPVLLSDLGVAGIMDALGRVTGRGLERRELGFVNLLALTVALVLLVLAWPAALRAFLIPALLLVPLSVREYRSVDVVAVHGAFAAMAVSIGAVIGRPWVAWWGVPLGLLLFSLHKLRSVYGLYALGAVVVVAAVLAVRARGFKPMVRFLVVVLAFAALEAPWTALTSERARDPRVVEGDSMTTHGFYQPLVSGVGWSENRWGTKPWDPWVATWIGKRLGKPVARIATVEGEADARAVYVSLWREDPGHMASIYLARVSRGIREHFFLGTPGFWLWLAVVSFALRLAWRRNEALLLAVNISPIVIISGLMCQVVLIDPRLLYAYPLRFVSLLSLCTAAGSLLVGHESPLRDRLSIWRREPIDGTIDATARDAGPGRE
jgi:hypothetical protein